MNKKIILLPGLVVSLFLPMVALAAELKVEKIITNVMDIIVWPVFIGAVVIMFIWAGILFATAQGDPSKITTAKKAVLWAVVGAIVGVVAFSGVKLIKTILGV